MDPRYKLAERIRTHLQTGLGRKRLSTSDNPKDPPADDALASEP
jgi:hypothetical protein